MRNRQLIARWVFERAADKVVELVKKDSNQNICIVVNDYKKGASSFSVSAAEYSVLLNLPVTLLPCFVVERYINW